MRGLSTAVVSPSAAPTGRRCCPVPHESGAVVEGAGLTRRAGPGARLEGGVGVQSVHHRLPPRRTDAAAPGTGSVIPPTGTGGAVSLPASLANLTVVRLGDQEGGADAQQ
jgi:hypothetical protein